MVHITHPYPGQNDTSYAKTMQQEEVENTTTITVVSIFYPETRETDYRTPRCSAQWGRTKVSCPECKHTDGESTKSTCAQKKYRDKTWACVENMWEIKQTSHCYTHVDIQYMNTQQHSPVWYNAFNAAMSERSSARALHSHRL